MLKMLPFHGQEPCSKGECRVRIKGMSTHAPAIDPRYPIGTFKYDGPYNPQQRRALMDVLADLPRNVRAAVAGLNESQTNTPYRDGGWTVRETVHHVADSHMNSFIRFRLALTEDKPTIKPYDEARWAEIADSKEPVEVSLQLIDALHRRMDVMLRSLSESDWKRTFVHPERGPMTLDMNLGLYAWHSRHHVAHITELRKRMGW
jgi:uncharacterized damage-inducible protein DinB